MTDYIEHRALSMDEDVEVDDDELTIRVDPSGVEDETVGIEGADPDESLSKSIAGYEPVGSDGQDSNGEIGYTESVGMQIDTVPDPDAAIEHLNSIGEISKEIERIRRYNEKMKNAGVKRRYITSPADVPDSRFVKSDQFGEYYYRLDDTVERADVASRIEWAEMDRADRVSAVLKELRDHYPLAVRDLSKREHLSEFLDRVLVCEDDVADGKDVFSVSFRENMADLLASANA